MRFNKKNGFTLLELMVSALVVVVVMSGATASLISTMKSDKQQRTAIYAQDLVKKIINEQVRNKPFMAEAATNGTTPDSLCGDPNVTGTVAYQLKNGTVTSTSQTTTGNITDKTAWIRTFSSSDIPDLSKYYSNSAVAKLIIRPIKVSDPDSSIVYYSPTRVEVTALVMWKSKESGNGFHQSEITTIATSNGSFDKTLPIIR